tara:strand:- start:136 stop:327 length:192 start_codon:yes stop_codon:yes gene_type:complete
VAVEAQAIILIIILQPQEVLEEEVLVKAGVMEMEPVLLIKVKMEAMVMQSLVVEPAAAAAAQE